MRSNSIPDSQLLPLSIECRENSLEHSNRAEKAYADTDYSLAISSSIYSVEEAVKALVFWVDSLGFSFRNVKGIDQILFRHEPRYSVAVIFFLLHRMFRDFRRFILSVRETGTLDSLKFDRILDGLTKYTKGRFYTYLRKDLRWFSSLTEKRTKAVHVDYRDIITSPKKASKREAFVALRRAIIVQEGVFGFIDSMNTQLDENDSTTGLTREHLSKAMDFMDRKGYSFISEFFKENPVKSVDSLLLKAYEALVVARSPLDEVELKTPLHRGENQ